MPRRQVDPLDRSRLLIRAMVIVGAMMIVAGFALRLAVRQARSQLAESRCDGHGEFIQSKWMDTTLSQGKLSIRGCMVDDMLAQHELRGMTRAQVIALLGEPTEKTLFPEYDMVYWLGPQRGLIGTDSEFLAIKLDAAGKVASAELIVG